MIEKRKKKYTAVCDICGNEIEPEETYKDVKEILYVAGWKSKKKEDGTWILMCDECVYNNKFKNNTENF